MDWKFIIWIIVLLVIPSVSAVSYIDRDVMDIDVCYGYIQVRVITDDEYDLLNCIQSEEDEKRWKCICPATITTRVWNDSKINLMIQYYLDYPKNDNNKRVYNRDVVVEFPKEKEKFRFNLGNFSWPVFFIFLVVAVLGFFSFKLFKKLFNKKDNEIEYSLTQEEFEAGQSKETIKQAEKIDAATKPQEPQQNTQIDFKKQLDKKVRAYWEEKRKAKDLNSSEYTYVDNGAQRNNYNQNQQDNQEDFR